MSRNLLRTDCYYCPSPKVELVGPEAPFVAHFPAFHEDYQREYASLRLRDAECPVCGAQYVAWMNWPGRSLHHEHALAEAGYCDLSFRSTFDDEPGPADLPVWKVVEERSLHWVSPWKGCGYADGTKDEHHKDCHSCAEAAAWRAEHADQLRRRRAVRVIDLIHPPDTAEWMTKTDAEIAALVLDHLWAHTTLGSRNEALISQIVERLKRTGGGPLEGFFEDPTLEWLQLRPEAVSLDYVERDPPDPPLEVAFTAESRPSNIRKAELGKGGVARFTLEPGTWRLFAGCTVRVRQHGTKGFTPVGTFDNAIQLPAWFDLGFSVYPDGRGLMLMAETAGRVAVARINDTERCAEALAWIARG